MEVRLFALAVVCVGVLRLGQSYTLRGGSVSWVAPSNDAAEDADLSEEDAPALLVDSAGLWKQAYSSPNVLGDSVESPVELVESENDNVAQRSSRLFSYRLEKVQKPTSRSSGPPSSPPPPHQDTARTARYIAHQSDWGHVATISTQDKVTQPARPPNLLWRLLRNLGHWFYKVCHLSWLSHQEFVKNAFPWNSGS